MNMDVVDSSLLFALFNAADEWHEDAKRAIGGPDPVLVPPGILQETLDLVRLRQGPRAANQALAWLQAQQPILLSTSRSDASFSAATKAAPRHPKLSFADVWCVAHAHEHELGLLTKDKDQKRAFAEWT